MGDLGKIIVVKGFKSCQTCNKSPNLVTLTLTQSCLFINTIYLASYLHTTSLVFPLNLNCRWKRVLRKSKTVKFKCTSGPIAKTRNILDMFWRRRLARYLCEILQPNCCCSLQQRRWNCQMSNGWAENMDLLPV